ncbi:MAG TPA: hypothetical protein VKV95_15690 [Terriglobia bacterium]|nr:hypothetical protein [Terriglobia bacterium]
MNELGKCPDKEKLFSYFHQMLDGNDELELRAHVARCRTCEQMINEFQEFDTLMGEWKPVDPSPYFDARLKAKVASAGAAQSGFPIFGLRRAQLLAPVFAVLLVVAATLIVFRTRSGFNPRPTVPAVVQTANTPPAKVEDELTLYENLPVLEDEDYDMLAKFDILSEVPHGVKKIAN